MPPASERDLTRIGLDAKEAKVYRAVLELGPSPVQQIAQRAAVPRATTYLALGSLQNKGLVTTYEKGKRTNYVAEPPARLFDLVSAAAEEIRARENLLKRLVPFLTTTGQFAGSARPAVRFYEGPRALKTLIRENLQPGRKEILTIYSRDDADRLLERIGLRWEVVVGRRKRLGIRRRTIHAWRARKPPAAGRTRRDVVYLPYEQLPCTADLAIVGDRVSLIPYDGPARAVAIEDRAIAGALRAVFNALWKKLRR